MKLLSLIILFFCLTELSANNVIKKNITSKVNEVTVFKKGAQVSRHKEIALGKGIHLLKFTKLSPFIDAKSIQVKANGSLTVLSVNHQLNYLLQVQNSNEQKVLKNKKSQVDEKIDLQYAYLSIVKEELEFLKANRHLGGKNDQLNLTSLQQTADYYGKRLTELKLKEIEYNKQIKDLQEEQSKIDHQINALSAKKEYPTGEILVKVDIKSACNTNFELSYLVNNAGWFPSYDIRAKNINEPVRLIYKANLRQDTKVNWDNVKLSFSSSDPKITGVAPELKTYLLDYNILPPGYQSIVNEISGRVVDDNNEALPGVTITVKGTSIGTVTNMEGYYSLTLPNNAAYLDFSFIGFEPKVLPITKNRLNVKLNPSVTDLDEVVMMGLGSSNMKGALAGSAAGLSVKPKRDKQVKIRGTNSLALPTKQVRNQTTVEFKIKQAYSIPSDNKNYTVDMEAYELESNYQYYCVPKIDRDAFLIAKISDWEQYNLLEGEANIFFEDTYIGKTLLDVRFASDTLDISLGRDKQVVVSREKVKNYTTKQLIGNKKQVGKAWETVIRNNKNEAINILVLDQVPVSTIEEIEVKIEELSKGQLDQENGQVSWDLQLLPAEKTELQLRYSVKYPKYRNLHIE